MSERATPKGNQGEKLLLEYIRANANDAHYLLELEARISGNPDSLSITLQEAEEEILENTLYLIRHQSNLVGTIAYKMRPDNSIYIGGVVVDPAYRRRGVGRAAMQYVLDKFKDAKRIDLVVHPKNKPARKLYESLGFIGQELVEDYYGDGQPRLVMAKEYIGI